MSDFPVLTWQFSQVDCETEKISSFTIHGGPAIQLDSKYEDKQHAKYWNRKPWFLRIGLHCFLVSGVKLGQNEKFKPHLLLFWLTIQKRLIYQGKTFSLGSFQMKTFQKVFQKVFQK